MDPSSAPARSPKTTPSPVGRSKSLPGTADATYGLGNVLPAVKLMYHPSMKKLAENVSAIVQTKKIENKINQDKKKSDNIRAVECCDSIKWETFKDGWPNIFIDDVDSIAGRDVIFLASFHSPQVIFEQLSLIYSFPRYYVRSFRLILPYFPTGTMERVDREGQVVTAKTLARILSVVPLAARGPAQIFIFDIHALQERFYFTDQIIPRLRSAIPYLVKELKETFDQSRIAIAFPDEGAWKRFRHYFEMWPLITCIKVRKNSDQRIVTVKEGDPAGKDIVIVDDLVQTGGTLIECSKALRSAGCNSISMFVTHAVFPNNAHEKFIGLDIKKFWITDSLPQAHEIAEHDPFEIISLSKGIVDSLLTYDILKDSA